MHERSVELLAHPLTDPYALPVSPLVLAYLTALTVVVAALARAPRRSGGGQEPGDVTAVAPDESVASWAATPGPWMWATRGIGVVLLLLAIVAGRVGVEDELENLAPALVVGAAWPLLVLVTICAGAVWRWVDPWDSLARLLGARDDAPRAGQGATDQPPPAVWPAVLLALPWLWYHSAYPGTLDPRSVGLALALYTLVTVAGCLAVGRVRWLSSAEPLGILLGWLSLLPRRRLRAWQPPAGADALLGVVAGGLLFGGVRRSEIWGSLNTTSNASLYATMGLVAATAAGATVLVLLGRTTTRRGDRADVTRAAVPTIAGIALAVSMERHRLTTSLQLLPGLLGDPLGRGWDVLGSAGAGLDAEPLGTVGLIAVQCGIVLVMAICGVMVTGRPPRSARLPVAVAAAFLVDAAVLSLATH